LQHCPARAARWPSCFWGGAGVLLCGCPRAAGRGSGENVIKVASAPDPAMAANSSSVMPSPPSPAASWDQSARGEQLPGLVKGEDGRRLGLAFRAGATRRVRPSRTLARHEFDASMEFDAEGESPVLAFAREGRAIRPRLRSLDRTKMPGRGHHHTLIIATAEMSASACLETLRRSTDSVLANEP
jgi:hypothetical protein